MGKRLYTLTIITTEGATVVVNSVTQIADSSGFTYFKLKPGSYPYNVSKIGYITKSGQVSVNDTASLNLTLTELPPLETVSLFHHNDSQNTDSNGFALAIQSGASVTQGKFGNGNTGWVRFKDNQWDSVWRCNGWTIDYWIYPRAASEWAVDFFLGGASNASAIFRAQSINTGFLFFVGNGISWALNNGAVDASMNTWHHVAIVYNGEACSIYVDGQRYHHFGLTIRAITGPQNYFGAGWGGQFKSNSYRDEIRISKGVRWTDNFTPPTSPE